MEGVLWKKETRNRESIYVDIFDGQRPLFSQWEVHRKMALSFSDDKKPQKNLLEYFTNVKLAMAMEDAEQAIQAINTAICFARSDEDELGFVHGYRAHLFRELKKYSLCLADLEIAMHLCGSDPYLAQMKKDCLELMEHGGGDTTDQVVDEPKLSFPADEKIPCYADGLRVKQSKTFGKHIVTNRKLEVGDTVIIEDAFCSSGAQDQKYLQCANCYKRDSHLISCKNCSGVMFCSDGCYEAGQSSFHAIECGKIYSFYDWESATRTTFRTVIEAIRLFPNIEDLMNTIEKFNNKKSGNRLSSDNPSVAAYMHFLGLSQRIGLTSYAENRMFLQHTYDMYGLITSYPEFRSMFAPIKTKRFLAHLIMHHFHVVDVNYARPYSYLRSAYENKLGIDPKKVLAFAFANAVFPNSYLLNHSCNPNIGRIFIGKKLIAKVIRPIKPGEHLFVSYV